MVRNFLIFLGIIVLATLIFVGGFFVAQTAVKPKKVNIMDLSGKDSEKSKILLSSIALEENISKEESEKNDQNQETDTQEENKFSFGIIGDTQYFKPGNANGGFQKAVELISSRNVDFIVAEGDLVSSCDGKSDCESKLNNWKNVLGPLYPKTYAVMGNHDQIGKEKASALWQKFFSFPTNGPAGYSELAYSFNFKNSHFVVLDSEKPKENVINGVQRAWLENDLNANKKENTFVFFHEPAYPVNSKIGESLDVKPGERDALWNILVSHNVSAVFNGHEHIASRRKVNNLYQFVFGNTDSFNHEAPKPGMAEYHYIGQSLGFVEVSGKKIAVHTYSTDGKLLNSFDFMK